MIPFMYNSIYTGIQLQRQKTDWWLPSVGNGRWEQSGGAIYRGEGEPCGDGTVLHLDGGDHTNLHT